MNHSNSNSKNNNSNTPETSSSSSTMGSEVSETPRPSLLLSTTPLKEKIKLDLKDEYNESCLDDPYNKECNKFLLKKELVESEVLRENPDQHPNLYPSLDDPNFIIKIAEKKEFRDNSYNGEIYDVKKHSEILNNADFELAPHQIFIKNFMSFNTPYNSLLLYQGLGTGKTCTAIGVAEEMRDYLNQMGVTKKIIIVASPNVQDNFRLQLFDERKMKLVDGLWNIRSCTGNKLLREINPMNMKGLTKEKVVSQIKVLINSAYSFMGYIEFANYIEKVQQIQVDVKSEKERLRRKRRNLRNEFDSRLIIIDEIHNVRMTNDCENKIVAEKLLQLVSSAENMRLLLLSATPMYNTYKEIIWLLNLMNMNDRRAVIEIRDIFDADGNFRKNEAGEEIGKELFIRKATGYISFVRGNNPYTFPYRIYPSTFSPKHSFFNKSDMKLDVMKYPKYQMNGKLIKPDKMLTFLDIYLTKIGSYQSYGYRYIINHLRNKKISITTKTGVVRNMPTFDELESFGYNLLMLPLDALNIIYPIEGLEELAGEVMTIRDYSSVSDESSEEPPLSEYKRTKKAKTVSSSVNESEEEISSSSSEDEEEEESSETLNNIEIVKKPSDEPSVAPFDYKPVETSEAFLVSSQNTVGDVIPTQQLSSGESSSYEEKNTMRFKIPSGSSASSRSSSTMSGGLSESSSSESSSRSSSESKNVFINTSEITGAGGLRRVMNFVDSKKPFEKGSFEYKPSILSKYGALFSADQIGKYSSKIKSICESIMGGEGIILVYSAMLDGSLIPVALALEEMGFSRFSKTGKSLFKNRPSELIDSRTMKPRRGDDFQPARYAMITGDPRLSPDNDYEVKALTNSDNINGNRVKVVLISRAGSEGIDLKCIRQVHIMDPWYNMNRVEQIIGRAVRNSSHKELEFEKRNVEIFMYGTILEDDEEESADLYVYRGAEYKAVQMGKVSRVLKETAVDCIIHHDQTNFIQENFEKIEENRNITQILSDGKVLEHFKIGDIPYSAECDYMESCDYKCYPDKENINVNMNSYNESFIVVNSDKIIQKIKMLMRERFFYKKRELIHLINIPKPYPIVQIYAALTQLIEEDTITDRYGRNGYLVNIGDYYLFQPSELKNKHISIDERSIPVDYKHQMIQFDVKPFVTGNVENVKAKPNIDNILEQDTAVSNKLIYEMRDNYNMTIHFMRSDEKVPRGDDNWYKHCGITFKKLIKENILGEGEALELLIEHIVDMLLFDEKVELLNTIYSANVDVLDDFEMSIKKYLDTKIIETRNISAIILYTSVKKQIMIYADRKWKHAQPEDVIEVETAYDSSAPVLNMADLIGFIDYENKHKYLVFKYKYTTLKRNAGARCDEAGKDRKIKLLNDIFGFEKYNKENTKGIVQAELCSLQEMMFRKYNKDKKDGKTWFFCMENAKLNNL
uniref:Helicase ATP-binding domain-containing protein n=1 Tax=viral metagenome TaxID=1070528 RepID=A0A6C0CVE0_9ZZZZ